MTAKLTAKFLTLGKDRASIQIVTGPWVDGVNPSLIKIKPRRIGAMFPASFRALQGFRDGTDSREDYFPPNEIRLLPGHPLYAAAKALAA